MNQSESPAEFPDELIVRLKKAQTLRYGENPHQSAALYTVEGGGGVGVAQALQVQGKELSYNNIQDADAALECASEFEEPVCVIVKHMNPCGVAVDTGVHGAYLKALATDPISAFGGIVAVNREIDEQFALELTKIFLEVVIAPKMTPGAMKILEAKPNVRVLMLSDWPKASRSEQVVRSIGGGFLVQGRDDRVFEGELQTATKRAPSKQELSDMRFAFTVCKHVKSNAIVYAKGGATLGIGAGQMSRIYSAKIAAVKAADAKLSLQGSVMASDAFFPFPDCVEAAHEVGATAIIQPGGSIKDKDSIDKADEYDMAMVMSGIRHFRH